MHKFREFTITLSQNPITAAWSFSVEVEDGNPLQPGLTPRCHVKSGAKIEGIFEAALRAIGAMIRYHRSNPTGGDDHANH